MQETRYGSLSGGTTPHLPPVDHTLEFDSGERQAARGSKLQQQEGAAASKQRIV